MEDRKHSCPRDLISRLSYLKEHPDLGLLRYDRDSNRDLQGEDETEYPNEAHVYEA